MWIRHTNLIKNIREWWSVQVDGLSMYKFAKKLSFVNINVQKWNKSSFGHIFNDKSSLKAGLDSIQKDIQVNGFTPTSQANENYFLSCLYCIIDKEEYF